MNFESREKIIPTELVDRFNDGNVALFVGDALGEEVSPTKRLTSKIVNDCGAYCDFCREDG